eukprot:TRINITY_DN37878_c0_g1_i1.p1 TRINITY_DN37878_c0_g1~~TRINITY_DN37878_c0_g1_i1.p1  ORF type:complete len:153 (+),score=32.85 TRINITY_DN37878_c0_g1_i1:208-666(+)
MRLRKMLWHFLVGYASLFLYGFLSFGIPDKNSISSHVVNVITMFATGTLAVMLELFTGAPSCVSIIPVILILAPGSTAVRISLEDIQHTAHVADAVLQIGIWDNLVLLSVTYAVGLYIVLEAFKGALRYKREVRVKAKTVVGRLTSMRLTSI